MVEPEGLNQSINKRNPFVPGMPAGVTGSNLRDDVYRNNRKRYKEKYDQYGFSTGQNFFKIHEQR